LQRATAAAPALPAGPRSFKTLFIAATGFLITAAIYTSVLVVQRQASLQAVSRYNVTWLLSQAAMEVARLEAVVGASVMLDSTVDRDDVQLWLDIVRNRARLFDSGDVREFIASSSELMTINGDFRTAVTEVQQLVDGLDHPGNAQQIMAKLTQLNPKLVRLAAASNDRGSELVNSDLTQLSLLHWIFSAVLAGLILSSFALIAVLYWHNRLLRQAHEEVNGLVIDLRHTGGQLAAANQRARQAVEEVKFQNQVLQTRESELNLQNARFDAALNNMSQALCMADGDQRLIVCNVRFLELFALSAEMVKPATPMAEVFHAMASSERYGSKLIEAIRDDQQALVFAHSPGHFLQETPDGPALTVSHQPMGGGGWVATYEDVTEHRHAEARIRFMAHHDGLTGLPNRVLFRDQMAAMLSEPVRNFERLAVLCLDLDAFKNVNDTLGHPVGDALLQRVAKRLRRCLRAEDVVARLGGDEFAILQRTAGQPDQTALLAQRIVETVGRPYDIDGQRAIVGVSIGIDIAAEPGTNPDLMLKNADIALYRAKAEGRGTYRFFIPEMTRYMQERRTMELDLREAMARQELEVYYQPIFNLAANAVRGFEALLRWRHASQGMISPAQFIPLAEELGLIHEIGEWMLYQACQEAACWPNGIKVAVNLSPVQFRSEKLASAIALALSRSGLAANRLELEITETVLLQESEKVLATLHGLRQIGVRIALDDFGTGYSSLSYLRSFPFDKLKIDQSFVREMATRQDCWLIVKAVTDLASQLGITTTAEGVETVEQLERIRQAGCAEAQGYYFDRPQPRTAIRRWFAQHLEEVSALG
jgi:diguanylate cyclase (GGDEF)-like protein